MAFKQQRNWYIFSYTQLYLNLIFIMSKISYLNSHQANQASILLATNKPAMPAEQKQTVMERRISDPSSGLPNDKRYPIPSFFEYRAKPKEFDSL